MLKSVVIEEKKFKHSPRVGETTNPLVPNFLCQQEGLITMVICCKFKKNFFNLWLYTHLDSSFDDLMNVHSRRSGADNPRGQNFDDNRNLLSLQPFATSFKRISPILYHFFMILYMHITLGQGLTTRWGQNFDVNRNILSFRSFIASFKNTSLKSDFIQFFSWFYTCIYPQGSCRQPPGDKVLMSTEMSCHFTHLLHVSKIVFEVWFYTIFSWFNTCT